MMRSPGPEIERLRALSGSPRDPSGRVFVPLADALRIDGFVEEARVEVEAGLLLHPTFSSGHVVAGWIYRDLGLLDLARESFERALELDPEQRKARADLERLETAPDVNADSPPGVSEIAEPDIEGVAVEDGLAWARKRGEQVPPKVVGDEVLTATMAELLVQQGVFAEAADVYEHLLQGEPENELFRSRLEEIRALAGPSEAEGDGDELTSMAAVPISDLAPEGVAVDTLAPEAVETPEAGETAEPAPILGVAALDPAVEAELEPEAHPDFGPDEQFIRDLAADGVPSTATLTDVPPPVPIASLGPDPVPVAQLAPDAPAAVLKDDRAKQASEPQASEPAEAPPESQVREADLGDFREWLNRLRK